MLQCTYQIHALWVRYMHYWTVCYDNTWTTGYKSIITHHCQDLGWYTHTPPSSLVHVYQPDPSMGCYNYTSTDEEELQNCNGCENSQHHLCESYRNQNSSANNFTNFAETFPPVMLKYYPNHCAVLQQCYVLSDHITRPYNYCFYNTVNCEVSVTPPYNFDQVLLKDKLYVKYKCTCRCRTLSLPLHHCPLCPLSTFLTPNTITTTTRSKKPTALVARLAM